MIVPHDHDVAPLLKSYQHFEKPTNIRMVKGNLSQRIPLQGVNSNYIFYF